MLGQEQAPLPPCNPKVAWYVTAAGPVLGNQRVTDEGAQTEMSRSPIELLGPGKRPQDLAQAKQAYQTDKCQQHVEFVFEGLA